MKKELINISAFRAWENNEITKLVMGYLQAYKEWMGLGLMDVSMVLGTDGLLKYSHIVGVRDGIDKILNLELSDLEESIDDEETTETPRMEVAGETGSFDG